MPPGVCLVAPPLAPPLHLGIPEDRMYLRMGYKIYKIEMIS